MTPESVWHQRPTSLSGHTPTPSGYSRPCSRPSPRRGPSLARAIERWIDGSAPPRSSRLSHSGTGRRHIDMLGHIDVLEPWWPAAGLAATQVVDAALCVKPVPFIVQCLIDVGFPQSRWWLLPPVKCAAAVGLVAGIWIPAIGFATTVALVVYFVLAVVMHIRAKDFGRNLFVNASGMLVLCIAMAVFLAGEL